MISTAAAIIGSAVIGGVASSISNRNAASTAANASNYAADQNAQLARENQAKIEGYITPYMAPAYGATGAIANRLGLGGTTRNVLSDGGMTTVGANGAVTTNALATGGQQGGQIDTAAYLAANPDVAQAYQAFAAGGGDRASYQGVTTPEQYAQRHYQIAGQAEGRQAVMVPQTQAPPEMYGGNPAPAPTYDRPGQAAAPGMPDLSLVSYKESPNYNWQLNEGQRNLNARAATGGLLNSGAAARDAISYGSNLALGDFNNWRNNQLGQWQLQLGQYNTDRNVLNDNFNSDRSFGYGAYTDQRNLGYNRFDTQTNDLFQLSNQGLSAAGTLAGQSGNTTANLMANNNSRAQTTANAALAGAQNTNNLIGQGLSAVGYYYGNKPSQAGAGGNPYATQTSYGPINPYRT